MNHIKKFLVGSTILLMLCAPGFGQEWMAKRSTLAISYPDGHESSVNIIGTSLVPTADGRAKIERKAGRTHIKFEMEHLGNPQALGAFYTTYILWAIAPEGQADSLAELPVRDKFDIDVTTTFQTFGLIVTAEPYATVKLPSPEIVAENTLRKGTEGGITSSKIEYRGDAGRLYALSMPGYASFDADYGTPLCVLGARRSVEIAKRAGAKEYANNELRDAEVKLAALENIWPRERKKEDRFDPMAHEVMRLAEHARSTSVDRFEAAKLDSERKMASNSIARVENQADPGQVRG